MEVDARVNDLHEMAAIGNLKAVLHYCQSGVNINAQNTMNGWTALHWATHRGHEPVVLALLMRGARRDILNNKGQTPADLAKKPEICELYGIEPAQSQEGKSDKQQECEEDLRKPTFVPAYLAQPDLSKLWSLPEGSTDDAKLNQEAFALSNPRLPVSTSDPRSIRATTNASAVGNSNALAAATAASSAAAATNSSHVAKEILVYSQTVADENLLGAIFANVEDTIEKTIHLIKEEIDDVPENFNLGRYNGSKTIPVNTKQYTRKTGDMFRGQEDAIVLFAK
ncbi:Ankyrin repeat domain-containing protein 40 [Mortierella claussenii]|nr:Ankyrin repeat domain-containing protein 40 [Mortierella claussenii]